MKFEQVSALAELAVLLRVLPNVHTIHVISCNSMSAFTCAFVGLKFPSVRTLAIPIQAYCLVGSCENVRDVRCVGAASGSLSILKGLRGGKCEVLSVRLTFGWTSKHMEGMTNPG